LPPAVQQIPKKNGAFFKQSTLDIVLASCGLTIPKTEQYFFKKSTLGIVLVSSGSNNHTKA
jgi:hypothetical protein